MAGDIHIYDGQTIKDYIDGAVIAYPESYLTFMGFKIVAGVTDCRLFTLAEKGARTYTFMPRRTWEAASNE